MDLMRLLKSSLYVTSILWSSYLILTSYQQGADLVTALVTVLVLLASMIFNDLLK
jgi:hypothetical protein